MCGIIGVFNNERSVEFVISGLEVLKNRKDADFLICTDSDEFYSKDVHELKQKVKQGSKNCIACCSCKTALSRKRLGSWFVADAEIYNVAEIKEDYSFLNETDGVFAFACWMGRDANGDDLLYIARDIIGLRPICFTHTDGFAFASYKKALEAMGYPMQSSLIREPP